MSDFTFALRQLVRRPWHTVAVVMCLAAGLTIPIAAGPKCLPKRIDIVFPRTPQGCKNFDR